MRAIISDVHGNLEAFKAVLADIEQQSIKCIYNLGDIFGYGPNPIECLDLATQLEMSLLGNFDYAVLYNPDSYCQSAEDSIFWTQALLAVEPDDLLKQRRADYLATLPHQYRDGDILYVHGSPRSPLNEYIFPEDVYAPSKMESNGAMFDRICFCGHTHVPGIFLELDSGQWDYLHAEECEHGYPVKNQKLICNVGAVGQPRDGDERACYAIFDGERIWIRRVEYDVAATREKIYVVPELADFLGDRLMEGR